MAYTFASSVGAASDGEPSMTASAIVGHTVGSHILRIDGYSHIKTLGNGRCFKSETFTVGGQHWWLEFYPGGVDSSCSDWISILLNLEDTYPFANEVRAKFTISFLDHDGNMVSSYRRTGSVHLNCRFSGSGRGRRGTNSAWGFNEFIRRRDLEASVYLKDDVFSIRCDVTVTAKEVLTKAIPVPAVRRSV